MCLLLSYLSQSAKLGYNVFMITKSTALLYLLILALLPQHAISQSNSQTQIQAYRTIVAAQNLKLVQAHNNKSTKSFTMKNYDRFSSLTQEERVAKYLIKQYQVNHLLVDASRPQKKVGFSFNFVSNNQRYVNWTQKGKVSAVKDQGFCGSCYAYSAIADIESSYLFRGIELDLSQQQIIDCSDAFGNDGCQGGWMANSFAYVMLRGVSEGVHYPDNIISQQYGSAAACLQHHGKYRIKSYRYTSYRIYDCEALSNILEHRPVTVAVAADDYFFFYYQGILDQCGQQINHGVFLTGFKQDQQENYWIVKNSWGVEWGEYGYVRIDREKRQGNLCQICYAPAYSII